MNKPFWKTGHDRATRTKHHSEQPEGSKPRRRNCNKMRTSAGKPYSGENPRENPGQWNKQQKASHREKALSRKASRGEWSPVGRLVMALGAPWGPSGTPWGSPRGTLKGHCGRRAGPWGLGNDLGSLWGRPGEPFATPWRAFGGRLGGLWRRLGSSLGCLGGGNKEMPWGKGRHARQVDPKGTPEEAKRLVQT